MASTIGQLQIEILTNVARLQADMDKATRSVGGAMASIQRSIGFAQKALLGLGVGVTFGALIGQVNKALDVLAKLDDMAQKTGSSVENLSRLQKVASQFGQDFGQVDAAIGKLARGLAGVDDAGGKTAKALNAIGISQQFVKSNDPSQVMVEVAKQLQKYQDGASKAALATDLFGKAGIELLPYLNDLAENVDKFTGATAEAAAQSAKFQDMLGGLKVGFNNLVETVTIGMLPTLTAFIDKLNQILKFKSIFSSVGGIEAKDYDKEIASRQKSLEDVTRMKAALSKPTTANKINDFIFGDVKDLTIQQTIYKDEISALQDLKKAQEALKASPYVTPNSDKKQLAYVGEEAQKALDSAREAAARQSKAARDKENAEILKEIQRQIDEEADSADTINAYKSEKQKDFVEYKLKLEKELNKKVEEIQDAALVSEGKRIQKERELKEDAIKKVADEQKRLAEDINRSLTDALLRGFESGKSFAKNFRDTLINMFQTLVLRPVIDIVLNKSGLTGLLTGLGGAFSGTAGATGLTAGGAGVQASGLLDQAKGLFDVVTKGFNTANDAVFKGVTDFGGVLRGLGESGGLLDDFGSALQLNSSIIGKALPFAGVALKLLQGDTKGALGAGLGAALSFTPLGPVGGLIGSVIGGSLFGGKKQPPRTVTQLPEVGEAFSRSLETLLKGFGLNDDVSANARYAGRAGGSGYGTIDASINGQSVVAQQTRYKGEYGDKTMQEFIASVLSTNLVQAIKATSLTDGIKSLFDGLTDKDAVQSMIQASINLQSVNSQLVDKLNLTADSAAKTAKQTGLAGQALADYVNKLAQFASSFQTPAQQLLTARDGLTKAFQSTLGEVVTTTYQEQVARQVQTGTVQTSGAGQFSNLGTLSTSNSFGGLNNFLNQQLTPIYTTVYDTVTKTIDKVVLSLKALPQNLNEFDSLLKSIDKTSAAGQGMFNTLFMMRDQFAAYIQALDGIKKGVADTIFGLETPQEQMRQNQARLTAEFAKFNLAVPATAQQLIAIGKGIDYTTESGLNLAIAFPTLVQAFEAVNGQAEQLGITLRQLDMSSFTTFADYAIAQSYVNAGRDIPAANMPSYAVGTSYVPNTGPALLHQGEAVLTKSENNSMTMNSGKVVSLLESLVNKVGALEYDMKRTAEGVQRTAKELEDLTGGYVSIRTEAAA